MVYVMYAAGILLCIVFILLFCDHLIMTIRIVTMRDTAFKCRDKDNNQGSGSLCRRFSARCEPRGRCYGFLTSVAERTGFTL